MHHLRSCRYHARRESTCSVSSLSCCCYLHGGQVTQPHCGAAQPHSQSCTPAHATPGVAADRGCSSPEFPAVHPHSAVRERSGIMACTASLQAGQCSYTLWCRFQSSQPHTREGSPVSSSELDSREPQVRECPYVMPIMMLASLLNSANRNGHLGRRRIQRLQLCGTRSSAQVRRVLGAKPLPNFHRPAYCSLVPRSFCQLANCCCCQLRSLGQPAVQIMLCGSCHLATSPVYMGCSHRSASCQTRKHCLNMPNLCLQCSLPCSAVMNPVSRSLS